MLPIYLDLTNARALGDSICATPTIKKLFERYERKINVISQYPEIFKNNPYVKDVLNFDEYFNRDLSDIIKYESHTFAGQKDWYGIEKKFSHMDVRQIHAIDLGFQLPNEDLEYDFNPEPLSLDVELPKKYVVLHVTTNWPNRTWAYDNWVELIKWLKENNIFTVLVGAGYKESLHLSYSDGSLIKDCPMFDDYYGLDLTNKGSIGDIAHGHTQAYRGFDDSVSVYSTGYSPKHHDIVAAREKGANTQIDGFAKREDEEDAYS
jgi:ADP-heptose:LPS heptosyltransferase